MPTTLAGRYNRAVAIGSVIGLGRRAAELLRAGGEARVLASLSASLYIVVQEQILWLGGPDGTLHPRAVLLSEPPAIGKWTPGQMLRMPPCTQSPWCPDAPPSGPGVAAAFRRGALRLAAGAAALGRPEGFGARLVGTRLAFPLAAAAGRADALAAACADDAPPRAAAAATALLGLGAGLTPSGDDFVGGAFFARALMARAGARECASWSAAAETVRAAAIAATHPISAALLGDLVAGEGWAPLHELADALAYDDEPAAIDAGRRLVRLGHSTGWDILAGFVAGATR
jgi:Protein of unknown function (DUF2877)